LAATKKQGIMLLILTPVISNRLTYITHLMMKVMLGIDVHFTTSAGDFSEYNGPKLAYALEPLAGGPFLEASGLLFETELKHQNVKFSNFEGVPVIFNTLNGLSELPFDPFAASFYMVSRYEEYHAHSKDRFNRYQPTDSVAWKGKFLELPVVHIWTGMVEGLLRKHYPGLVFKYPQYHYVPTIDIDHAWCYLGRTLFRTAGGVGRDFMHGRFREINNRFRVLAGFEKDTFDNYDFINQVHDNVGEFPLFFILFANYGRNDNNVTVTSKNFQQLVRQLDRHGRVGLHPSLSSNKHKSRLAKEYQGLSRVIGRNVTISRQHFLKFSMPRTYRNLQRLGITDDYSMGYASCPGFRAGIAIPFPFFDLLANESTGLVIHPFTIMDVTLKHYLRLTRADSLEKIGHLVQTVKSVHGEFVSLWHNESLGDKDQWTGWREVYEEMVKLASV
jgi:hypothetical protein